MTELDNTGESDELMRGESVFDIRTVLAQNVPILISPTRPSPPLVFIKMCKMRPKDYAYGPMTRRMLLAHTLLEFLSSG
jgi:hypothetical protein